jgi:ABC-type multidrug transport system ATPase subunit
VDLEVPVGMFGLLGPNGAGKSTLMRSSPACSSRPRARYARRRGRARAPERVRERLGYLPQDFGFYPHLSGEQMLVHLLRLKGVESPTGEQGARRRAARPR